MKRKFMSLLLALAMICSMFVPAMAADKQDIAPAPYTVPADVKGKLVILHTNDTHGGDVAGATSVGTAGVAQLKKDFEAAGAEVLLFSAGDAIQGAPIVNQDYGASEVAFMNAAGYSAMTVGNHEFDWGTDNLLKLAKDMKFPVLCANLVKKDTGKPLFDANKIFTTASGLKVGVFGLATPETATKANPKYMADIKFLAGEELYKCAQAQVDQLKKNGAQVIVALGHLGVDAGSEPNRSVDVIKNVKGIDLFIDGHSHSDNTVVAEAAGGSNVLNGTLIVSTGTKLANVGVVIRTGDKLDFGYASAGGYTATDADVAKLVNDRDAIVTAELAAVIGKTEMNLNGSREGGLDKDSGLKFPKGEGVRVSETNLGNFATDALLWQARKELGEDKVDAAFTNGGGIRAAIPAGDVSMKTMKTVFPYGNTVYTLDLTGAQLLEILEANTNTTPATNGGFPQVSGIKYIINTAVPYENGELYPDSTFYAPKNPGSRVTVVTVNDKPFDLKATYTLATNDFTAAGGDAYYVLTQATNGVNTGVGMEDALVAYTKEVLKGTITAEKYGTTDDRILIIPADVKPNVWYSDAVYYVLAEHIMSGTSGNAFNPSGTVTRGTMYQILFNMEGKPTAGAEKAAFNDLTGKWYSAAAHWAGFIGLAKGEADGGFHGDDVITRAEIAQIIADYATNKGIVVGNGGMAMKEAPDYSTIPAEYLSGMTYCYYAGIMTGGTGNMLLPNANVTRDQLAQIMYKYAKVASTPAETVTPVKATVTEIEKYGHAVLDVTIADFEAMGYTLGDTVNVTFDSGVTVKGIPYFNGYYVDKGEYMLRAYPGMTNLAVCINYGKLNEVAKVVVGSKATITLAEKEGALDTQTLNSLKYTNVRDDYSSDEVFANFRPVELGNIAEGVLYRSASPVNNENGRAAYGDNLIEAAGIKTVLNLADTKKDIDGYIAAEGFDSPYYKGLYTNGSVIALGMPVDYSSASFAKDLVAGIATMSGKSGPYLVHCTEGKDRAGFTSALLEALMGATKDEIVADYMVSYANYYGVDQAKDAAKYQLIVNNNIIGMLETIAGVKKGADLSKVDWSKAAEKYLTSNGMTTAQVTALKTALSTPIAAEKAA